ncbi:hypothetical protein [Acinetobacter larvae]|uniref:Uncharacterized protein n=1 Tax=Acinetobacter larvae TaxID=1789224 RepID=A0A1B2LW80_9GAMM|nr:hypothetical protein [Acinetobacter larvae]AOA57195.1 hypothetical protein BFG52_01725 [Acinetobacter larvae]
MNSKFLVKISNIIGLVAILLLIYWVFSFSLVSIFGLKIFREQLSNTFLMSIFGILSLMAGALMLNIMFNLTRIAERDQTARQQPPPRKLLIALLLLFPLLAALLFAGDYLSAQKKKQIFIATAEQMLQTQPQRFQQLSNYQFNAPYIVNSAEHLEFLSLLDNSFADLSVVVPDQIDHSPVYLSFSKNYPMQTVRAADADEVEQAAEQVVEVATAIETQPSNEKPLQRVLLDKKHYVQRLSLAEKDYLNAVFQQQQQKLYFESKDGNYTLYYPYEHQGKRIVLVFSDRQRYGKFGS